MRWWRKVPSSRRESSPRTPIVQPVAQRYTDWAITAHIAFCVLGKQSGKMWIGFILLKIGKSLWALVNMVMNSSPGLLGCDAISFVAGYKHFRRLCCTHFHPESGGRKVLRNLMILSQHYTASQSRRPGLESSPSWKPQILLINKPSGSLQGGEFLA
jgi:hypothetical protein